MAVVRTLQQVLIDQIQELPVEEQREVLEFVKSLQIKNTQKKLRRDPRELFTDLQTHVTEEDLAEARREM